MAKLGSYYGLCPLIDQKNLLGVTQDVEPGHVVLTLGKNIAIKYRLTDQKQIHSWRTKEKFSSPVIYTAENEQYVAVFNQIHIRMWNGNEEYLDKSKKFKFNKPIYTLTSYMNKVFVVFNDADVVPLSSALENRKTTISGESSGTILDVVTSSINDSIYVGVMVKFEYGLNFACYVFNDGKCDVFKIDVVREDGNVVLTGHTLTPLVHQNYLVLLTLWSDGRLQYFPVGNDSGLDENKDFGIVESLSYKQPVTMVSLQHHYIAMYGANINEEGAILVLYNLQFKVSQLRQPLKLFSAGAKLWQIENNLLFCIGQNLAVIPFSLSSEKLSALVGSHRVALTELDPDISIIEEIAEVTWDEDVRHVNYTHPIELEPHLTELTKQGMPESLICDQLILIYLETKNINAITVSLEYFKDISESTIAKLLKFSLSNKVQVLLDKTLALPFSEVLLLPFIRKDFDLNNTLSLLQHICYLMSSEGYSIPTLNINDSDRKLVEWTCLLLDANYQKLLLSKDVEVLAILSSCSKLVEEKLACLENLKQVEPILLEMKRGKVGSKSNTISKCNVNYSIEQLSFY